MAVNDKEFLDEYDSWHESGYCCRYEGGVHWLVIYENGHVSKWPMGSEDLKKIKEWCEYGVE